MKRHLTRVVKPLVERVPRMAMTYRHVRDSWRIHEKPRNTQMGFKFTGNRAMQSGSFEPDETKLVKQIIPRVDIFINVGANIGYYCCIALSYAKYVIAFEPMEMNLRCMLRNIYANSWGAMAEIYPVALSDKVGIAALYGAGTGASLVKGWAGTSEQHATLVPNSTLDNVLNTRFLGKRCFILMDVEGAERSVLSGASITFNMVPKPIWMVEISISKHQPAGVDLNPELLATFQLFWDAGYEAFTADSQCRVVMPEELEEIVETGVDTIHSDNFLFMEIGLKNEVLDALQ